MTRFVGLAVCLLFVIGVNCNEVKVNFLDFNRQEWTAIESTVKSTVTSQLNEYCKSSEVDCKLTMTSNISASVTFSGTKGNFDIVGRYAVVKVSATSNGETLTSEVLEQFFIARRQNIVEGSNAPIAFVNDVLVFPPRDNTDNYIIISISSTIVFGLFVLNLILTKKRADDVKKQLENGVKKDIYKTKEKKGADENKSSPVKNRSVNMNKSEEMMPLNPLEDEDRVPGFPKANEDPMLSTSDSMYNGVRVNPNMRLTQV